MSSSIFISRSIWYQCINLKSLVHIQIFCFVSSEFITILEKTTQLSLRNKTNLHKTFSAGKCIYFLILTINFIKYTLISYPYFFLYLFCHYNLLKNHENIAIDFFRGYKHYFWVVLLFTAISIWWKSYVFSLTTDSSCETSTIYTHKFLQDFHTNSMKLKNGYYESCFCGLTVWFNSRLWFMLLFSLCTCSGSYFKCFSQVWKEVGQTHECCSHKPVCLRESKTGRFIKS